MEFINKISVIILPLMVFCIVGFGIFRGDSVYDSFAEGAAEGIKNLFKILPPIIGILVAIGMLKASGTLELLVWLIRPVTSFLGIPPEVVPLALLRPISGSGSIAVVSDTIKAYGVDSFIGRAAATIMGCTETTFYTMAVYFGSVGIKNSRYTLSAALISDVTGILVSVWIWKIFM